jgi:hypothetical protein
MRSVDRAFIWLTAGVAAALLLPALAMDGMFMDGMLYSVVAHNQANGFGTFWFPRFSVFTIAGLETFHEQPPLGFGLQAIWFRLFGSAFWVERAYSLLMAIITGWLMILIWRSWSTIRPAIRDLAWFPLLLWIIIPTAHWCFHNNMMETTLGVFTTAAILFVVKAHVQGRWYFHAIAGVMVFLATLTKGLPGAFPLAAPLIISLCMKDRIRKGLVGCVIMFAMFAVCYSLLLIDTDARISLGTYVNERLLHRIAEDPTVENRFATLEMLFTNLIGPLVIAGLLFVTVRKMKSMTNTYQLPRVPFAMLLIGLSGVAPMMLTMVQKSFYMAAALPCIAIALGLWAAPWLEQIVLRLEGSIKVLRSIQWIGRSAVVGAIAASFFLFGKPLRDKEMLHDVEAIGEVVPEWSVIQAPYAVWDRWNLQTYLMRKHFISLAGTEGDHIWYLIEKNAELPIGYHRVPLNTLEYELLKKLK